MINQKIKMNIVFKQRESGELVKMLIDSGAENSMINKLVWEQLGRPELIPTRMKLIMASGATVDLLGKFSADIIFDGHRYKLPVYVTNIDNSPNVIGWRWFPILDLNWNIIFNTKEFGIRNISRKHKKKLKSSKSTLQRTKHFYITINVEGVDFPMILDSGAAYSSISLAHWEKLGKPKIKPDSHRPMIDAAGETMDTAGKCWVKVKYLERHRLLPLRVIRNCHLAIIGTNWFHSLHFDFNSIFHGHDNEGPSGAADSSQQNDKKGKFQQIIQNTWAKIKVWFWAWLYEDVGRGYWLLMNLKKVPTNERISQV